MPTDPYLPPAERDLPFDRLQARREHLLRAVRGEGQRQAALKLPTRERKYALGILLLATAVGAVIATPAFGIVHAIRDLFEGTPPTPLVQKHFINSNEGVQKLTADPPPGIKLPLADTTKVHGIVSVNTSDGPLNLWAAPVGNDGRQCWLVQFANDQNADNTVYGPSGCDIRAPSGSAINWGDFLTTAHPSVRVLVGEALGAAESIKVELSDGSSLTAPVTEHLFLVGHDPGAVVRKVTSFDAEGAALTTSSHGNVVGG
jgi:hypothetical protein